MKKRERNKTNKNDCSNPRGFEKIKTYAIKAVKSIALAIGCITASVVVSVPTAQAAIRGSVSTTNQSASQGQPIKSRAPVQHGKLILRNDTEIGSLIFLHAPGADNFTRYTYVPACTARVMSAEYSTKWRASPDTVNQSSIVVGVGGVLEVTRSTLAHTTPAVGCDVSMQKQAMTVATALKSTDSASTRALSAAPVAIEFIGITSFADDAQRLNNIFRRTTAAAKQAPTPEVAVAIANKGRDEVAALMTNLVKESLRKTGRTPNVKDEQELLLVARYIKGNGEDLETAAMRLEKYLKDCDLVFAKSGDALALLQVMQKGGWVDQSFKKLAQKYRSILAENYPIAIDRTKRHIVAVNLINSKIIPDTTNQMSSLGILCVKEDASKLYLQHTKL